MDYIEVSFVIQPKSTGTEIMIALLSQIGYESFMETEEGLMAYITATVYKQSDLDDLAILLSKDFSITYAQQLLKSQNWNEVWENSFNPVVIMEMVYVRAPFHKTDSSFKYEIIIEPKMSFGTAHHETTSMMIELMLKEDFSGSSVLDMGCGTGILAILAEMLTAKSILAIDNDEWAYENALENVRKNNCRKISVFMGNAGLLKDERFNFILANINRNILLEDMEIYAKHLMNEGILLLSGFYTEDSNIISRKASDYGLIPDIQVVKNNWVAARYIKSNQPG
jgi:ribosomal protein L11 methyltransferase